MAKDLTITITQVVSGNYQPVTTLTELNLRAAPFATATYAGTHIGDGVYKFESVEDGTYKLFNDSTEVTKWGGTNGRWVGDEALPYMGLASEDEWGGQDKQLTSIADPTEGYHVGDVDFNDGRYLRLSGDVMTGNIAMGGNDVTGSGNLLDKTSSQTASGAKGWSGFQTWSGGARFEPGAAGSSYPKIYYESELSGPTYIAPSDPYHIATKQYADGLVAGITVPAVPYSATEVIVIHNITQVLGKIYSSIINASSYLNTLSLSLTRRGVIYLRNNPNTNYYVAASGALQNYQNWVGYAPALINSTGDYNVWNNLGTVVVVCESTATKKMTISNCTLIFGNSNVFITGNQTGERTYSEFCFNNCVIIAYNNTSFNNCLLKDCTIIHSGAYKATLENCSVMNCFFNNEPDIDDTNEPALYSAGFSWNIPNDITAHIEIGGS